MSKIKIYTTCYIKPEFIYLQNETFKKFCEDDYEIIIINNAYDNINNNSIVEACNVLNLQRIDINKGGNKAEFCSQSHRVAIEYTLQNYIKKDKGVGINVIMDNDIFAFKKFSLLKMMNGKKIAGMYQQRTDYEYPAAILIMIDSSIDLTDFSFHKGIGDTGGSVNLLMKENNIVPEWIKHTAAIDIETDYIFRCNKNNPFPYESRFRCQFFEDKLIHYYRGSNWEGNNPSYDRIKMQFIKNLISNPDSYCLNLDENVCYEYAQSNKGYNGADHHYHGYRYIDNIKK